MGHRHKHADLIIEWAETGCQIEFFNPHSNTWIEVSPKWYDYYSYRKKPKTVKYKKYIVKSNSGELEIKIHPWKSLRLNQSIIERQDNFIKWIDKEWQEVEI